MVKFNKVTESTGLVKAPQMQIGTHLVKIAKVMDKKRAKKGDRTSELIDITDLNGNIGWYVIFENAEKEEWFATQYFGGGAGQATVNLLRAVGVLDADEDYMETDWQPEMIKDKYLQIELVTGDSVDYPIALPFDGYTAIVAPEPVKKTSKALF